MSLYDFLNISFKARITTNMDIFPLDYRLEKDCIKLGFIGDSTVLLMNNSLVPWMILVPSTGAIDEFDQLGLDQQIELLDQINLISHFLRHHFQFDKLNIATIGNIVRQMHIHIVARSVDDYCWPGVVWGAGGRKAWSDDETKNIAQQLANFLSEDFKLANI